MNKIQIQQQQEKGIAGASPKKELSISPLNNGALNTQITNISMDKAKNLFWQVFFVPKGDMFRPSSIIAFCPFTQVIAEGSSVEDASRKWSQIAKKKLQRRFNVPKYLITSRKIWYGSITRPITSTRIPSQKEEQNVFAFDFDFTSMAVAFNSSSLQILEGRLEDLQQQQSHDSSSTPLPSMWFDWRLQCTPLFEQQQLHHFDDNSNNTHHTTNNTFTTCCCHQQQQQHSISPSLVTSPIQHDQSCKISLTPHCIN